MFQDLLRASVTPWPRQRSAKFKLKDNARARSLPFGRLLALHRYGLRYPMRNPERSLRFGQQLRYEALALRDSLDFNGDRLDSLFQTVESIW